VFLKWLIFLIWRPFEIFSRFNPIIPLQLRVDTVAPGVEMIRLNNVATRLLSKLSGGYGYAVLFIVDEELVFDTGYAWGQRILSRYLSDRGLNEKLTTIVNSHFHEDHCGNNKALLESCPNSRVYAHPLDASNMVYPSDPPWYRRFLFGPIEPHEVSAIPQAFTLSTGRTLRVLETPGHTPGHICLYDEKNQILFAGDLFIDVAVDTQLSEVNGVKWVESLQKVSKYPLELLLDGHGTVLKGPAAAEAVMAKTRFLTSLQSHVETIVAKGEPQNLNHLVEAVFRDPTLVNFISMNEGWMSVITGGDFSRSNLIRAFVEEAHTKRLADHPPSN